MADMIGVVRKWNRKQTVQLVSLKKVSESINNRYLHFPMETK